MHLGLSIRVRFCFSRSHNIKYYDTNDSFRRIPKAIFIWEEGMNDLVINPYVIQMDKFVTSLKKLSQVFLDMEENPLFFSEEEIRQICDRIFEKTCDKCENAELCLGRNRHLTYALVRDIFQTVEDCGSELSIEVKRKTQKNCEQAPRFLRQAVDTYREEKQKLLWNQKLALNREGCANQLDFFARTIQHATRELDASIFADEYLDKKIRQRCTQLGLKVLTTIFFVTEDGRYEIHVTVRAMKGQCISCKELAESISQSCGRTMILGKEERTVVGQEYCTITFVEGPRFYTLSGVARIGKGRRKVSGDSFSMLDLPGGKQGIILSDGMGAGEAAYRESSMVVEVLEELLEAGFPKKTALQMINTALVTGREDVRFSTIDMASFDLYSGKCEFLKAGAATTYIRQ